MNPSLICSLAGYLVFESCNMDYGFEFSPVICCKSQWHC